MPRKIHELQMKIRVDKISRLTGNNYTTIVGIEADSGAWLQVSFLITPPLRVVKNGRNSQTYMVRRKTFFLPHHSSAQRFMSMEKHKTTLDLKSVVDRNVEACPPVKEDENPTLDLISILEGEGITLLNVIEALNPHLNTPEMQRVTLLIRSSKEKDIPKSEVVMKIQQIVGESLMSDVVTRLWKKLLKVAS
ncbi:uncharacterized protein [Rutidosis leptorrhynchoides]|uniref:uncharacterized protein isoform X2 n=1 Tax=Rutidosis leptorrhynchoides TaxID=125765 RepID=UPI003A9A0291